MRPSAATHDHAALPFFFLTGTLSHRHQQPINGGGTNLKQLLSNGCFQLPVPVSLNCGQ